MSFEPRILGFLCNWCSYAGADLAGVSRVQYPPNIRVIRVMCSGRVDPKFVINALKIGIDGVIVMGCHPGDCHYLEGNYEAEKKYDMTEGLLKFVGLDNRIRLEWVSASEGVRFGEVVKDFTDTIRDLGPSPLSGDQIDQNLLDKLIALEKAASSNRLRALVGRQRKITEDENTYGVKFPEERFDEILDQAMKEEYERNRVLVALEKDSKSVKDIAIELDLDSSVVLEHVLTLKARSLVDFEKIIGNTPIFMRM
jgi:coenzyme F420-reducing hydrogenase delta subunit